MRRPFCLFSERMANMHFLTLTAVQVSNMTEDLEQNKIVEEQKTKLQEAIQANGRETAVHSVFLQRLDQLSTTFSRAVDEAVAEQLEPFNTSTEDPNYLEFVDQTEELKREYEGTIDCIKLPQGKIVPARYGFYQNRFEIQNGKVFQRKAGPARQPRRTKRAKRMQVYQNYPFQKLYRDFRQFAEEWAFADWHEEQQAYGYYSNPDAQWDWYSIGGRWPCQLLVKDSCTVYVPSEFEPGDADGDRRPPKGYRWVSAARMKNIQWDAIRKHHRAVLAERYSRLKDIFQTRVLPQGFYGKCEEDGIQLGGELIFRKDETLEEYLFRTDWYRTRKYPMPTCNFLDLDGNWEGEASFGWNSYSQDWEDALDDFLSGLSPEDVLVVVDCHI